MKKKGLLILGVIVGALIAVPLLAYAMLYVGEYALTVNVTVVSPAYAEAEVIAFETTAEPMGAFSLFDVLKGRGGSTLANFTVFVSVTQGGVTDTLSQSSLVFYTFPVEDADPVEMAFTFYEKEAGEADVRVYIEHVYTSSVVYDNTWTVNIA